MMRTTIQAIAICLLALVAGPTIADRRVMPLECFDREALRYVEYRWPWAMVLSPDDVLHRVRKNDYLGRSDGRVVRITRTEIQLVELVPDGDGGWLESPVVLPFVGRGKDGRDLPAELKIDHCKAGDRGRLMQEAS